MNNGSQGNAVTPVVSMQNTISVTHTSYLRQPLIVVLFCLGCSLNAQDIHYSQVGNSPQNTNPGLIGVFNGSDRIVANFRDQWRVVPVPYLQLSAAYDHRFYDEKERPSPFAMGLNFNYDEAGDLGLSWTNIGLGGSWSHRISKKKQHFLSLGLNGSVNQRRFDPTNATFDADYDLKEGRIPGMTPSESFNRSSRWFSDLAAGINLRLQSDSSRSRVDFGAGMFHLGEPKISFRGDSDVVLPRRFNAMANAAVQLAPKLDLLLHAMAQWQGEYNEVLIGGGAMIHLNQKKTSELALQFGGIYRVNDAIAPWVALHWSAWQFHFSYDITTSSFNGINNGNGGPELTVIYTIKKVPPMEYCALCPKYM